MSKEQINLSDALDLIAQSKSDIKGSVEYKGGTIGDDLTEYSTSINNIQFRSIYVEENTVEVPMYGSYVTIDALQYINGNKSYPTNISYTVSGSSSEVEWVDNPTERGPQQFNVTPVNYGTTTLVIEDEMGNCNYPITLTTSTVTFTAELTYKQHFDWGDDGSYPEGTIALEWEGSSNFSLYFKVYNSNDNSVIPPTALVDSIGLSGNAIDNNLMTITPSVYQQENEVKLTIEPANNTLYNTDFYVNFTDGYSETGDLHIVFVGGVDPEPVTYSINEAMIDHCTVTINPNPAAEGETVTVTVTPNQGQVFDSIEAHGFDTFTNITITDLGNNQYSFTMPAENVELSVYCVSSGGDEPTEPYFSSPANGDTLTGMLNSDNNYEYKYPLEICYGDGTPIPNNLIVDYTTVDNNNNWTIRHDTADDGNGSYISNVYLYFNAGGEGDVTLIYSDAMEGLYASSSFHYAIWEDN